MHGFELKADEADALARFARPSTPPASVALPRWAPVLEPVLELSGEGVSRTEGGWQIDFGRLPTRGESWRTVRLESLGQDSVLVRRPSASGRGLGQRGIEGDAYLARGGVPLEFQVGLRADELGDDRSSLRWSIEAESGRGLRRSSGLRPRFEVPTLPPRGRYSFHGAERPVMFDFGRISPEASPVVYELRVEPEAPEPVMVSLSHLTRGLVVERGADRFEGPQPGLFCRVPSPVSIRVSPDAASLPEGRGFGRLVVETDDERADCRRFELEFTASVVPRAALVEVLPPALCRVARGGRVRVDLLFRNRAPRAITLEPQSAVSCETGGVLHLPAASATEASWVTRTVVLTDIEAEEAQRVLVFECPTATLAPVVVRIPLAVVTLHAAFAGLDFGPALPGEHRTLALPFTSTGADIPRFEVRVLSQLCTVLTAHFEGETLWATLRPDAAAVKRWPRYDGPGLEVTVPELGFVREFGVRFQTRGSWTERLRRVLFSNAPEAES